jgi:hypothetical protein
VVSAPRSPSPSPIQWRIPPLVHVAHPNRKPEPPRKLKLHKLPVPGAMISPIHPIFLLWAILSLFGSGTSLSRFDNNAVVKAEDGTHDPRKGNVPCTFSEQATKRKWRGRCRFCVKVSDLHKLLGPRRNCGDCGRTTWTSGRKSCRLGMGVVRGFPLL